MSLIPFTFLILISDNHTQLAKLSGTDQLIRWFDEHRDFIEIHRSYKDLPDGSTICKVFVS